MTSGGGLSRRRLLRAGLGAVTAALVGGPGRAAAESERPSGPAPAAPAGSSSGALNLYTWEGYAPATLEEQFERKTGIKVTVTTYASNKELLAKLKSNRGGYDLVQPTVPLVPAGVAEELYRPLEPDRLRNGGRLIPSILRAAEAIGGTLRGQRYALPFAWGAEGLAYNTRRLARRPDSYGVLHDDAHAGRVSYRASIQAFVTTGLWLGLGNRMRDIYVSEGDARPVLDAALERLIESKKLVRAYWSTGEEIEEWLATEAVDVAETWDGIAWGLARRGRPVAFVAPREGALAWLDGFAVPRAARNVDQAYAWMDFVYEPRNAAAFTTGTGFGTAVEGATLLLEAGLKAQHEASFSRADVDNLWWYGPEYSWWLKLVTEYVDRLNAA
jgi:spermidine/putrescine transport system substrate-binding protein